MRSYGRFTTTIWRDPEFTSLSQPLQAVYFMLCTQPDVSAAGTLALTPGRWAKLSTGVDRREVEEQLVALQAHAGKHVVIDEDTEELLIRTFVKWDGGWSNTVKRLPVLIEAVGTIASVHIRDIVVEELRKIAVSKPVSDSDSKARDALLDRLSRFDRSALAFDLEPLTSLPKPQPGAVVAADAAPPSMFCDLHPNGTTEKCGACARAREMYAAWSQTKLTDELAAKAAAKAAIAACRDCGPTGIREHPQTKQPLGRCDHSGSVVVAANFGGVSG